MLDTEARRGQASASPHKRGLMRAAIILLLALLATAPASAQFCKGASVKMGKEMRCLAPAATFKDCPTCPEMVVIPAGRFQMGSDDNASDEQPVHTVTFRRPFAMSRTEVTFALWDLCVAEGGCKHKPDDHGWGRDDRPAIEISYNDIVREFLPWLSKRAGHRYRLPSEAEWEYAARGGTTTVYSWGDAVGTGNANCDRCGSRWDNKTTAPVGSFAANPFGLFDMHGNVWEWTADCYENSYKGAPADGRARAKANCGNLVVRGGGYNDRPQYLRSAIRYGDPPGYRSIYVGLRLVRDF